jgi:hypothetical protein
MRATMGMALLTLAGAAPALRAQIVEPTKPFVVREFLHRTDRDVADTSGTAFPVPAPAPWAFSRLAAVFAELRIAGVEQDSSQYLVGVGKLIARGELAGKRMSLYLECGGGITGLYADDNRLDLTLVSHLRPSEAGSSILRTVLIGSAVNVGEGAAATHTCQSTGELEKRIYQLLLRKLKP